MENTLLLVKRTGIKNMRKSYVHILGGYQTDFERNWSKEKKHIVAMMRESFEGSLADTDIDISDIDSAIVGNFTGELFTNQAILGAFFLEFSPQFNGLPTLRVEAACASGSIAILTAMSFIKAGLYDLICVIGVEQMKTVSAEKGAQFLGSASWFENEAQGIEFPFPALFGRLADEYDKRYGLDSKYLAAIVAKNFSNAKKNENAQTRKWYMSFEHANKVSQFNQIMWGNIKVSDCSQITDGSVCLYLCSEKYAREYAKKRNIDVSQIPVIRGWSHKTAPIEFSKKIADSFSEEYILPVTRATILEALSRANLKDCWDLDLIETHDCFSSSEYMAIDHFGLTEPGQSWKAIEEEIVQFGGKLPVNPSGGLIGCGHPVGATGVRQVLDAFKQVTGQAKAYQIENAKTVATLNIGGSATTNVCLVIGKPNF